MSLIFRIVVLLLLLTNFALIEASEEKKRSGWFSVNAVLFYQSQNVEKGALVWPGMSVLPGIGLTFFEQLSIKGLELSWEPFDKNSPHQLEISFYRFDDGAPWIKLTQADENYRNQRRAVWETSIDYKYQFGYRDAFYIGGKFVQAVSQYEDVYFELKLGAPVLPYTQLQFLAAVMPENTIRYYYGEGSQAGFSHIGAGLLHFYPKLPWGGVWINKLNFSYILNKKNQQARYIRGQKENISWKSIVSWKLY